ncbi:hypothetical protein HOY82DRAFT_535756 [Tuber indicum]|nr:hypothetical protein HOY82DRAFT_535756 [Tuber indicum]
MHQYEQIFSKHEIERLVWCLEIPEKVSADNMIYEPDGVALCMLLARLTWPHRLSDMHLQFGWKPERVSRITNTLLRFIYNRWHYLLVFDMEGRIHDAAVWTESGISKILDTYAYAPNGSALQIYGDQAYGIGNHLILPFGGATVT